MEQQTHITDRDRLRAAFKQLRKDHGFTARMNLLCCQSCANADLDAEGITDDDPYVYWHGQDDDAFCIRQSSYGGDGPKDQNLHAPMYLAHGSTVEHGVQIVTALAQQGLKVEWDGDTMHRIKVASANA